MKVRVLTVLLILVFSLCLTARPVVAAEQVRTAWCGERDAFLIWLAKQKGWDREAGIDIRMYHLGSDETSLSRQGGPQWDIAGCGIVPTLMSVRKGQFHVIGVGSDESKWNALFVRPDSPILKAAGTNPQHPDVYGSPDTVRGKTILCPEKTSARYLISTWLHIIGLKDEDVTIRVTPPGQALNMFSKGHGDAVYLEAPDTFVASSRIGKGYSFITTAPECGISQPALLLADRTFADKHPEQVLAFLRVYLRAVTALYSEEFDPVEEYIRFNKEWSNKTLTREKAVEEMSACTVFGLSGQVSFLSPQLGSFRALLSSLLSFLGRSGELSQEDISGLNTFDFLNDSFLQKLIEE